MQLPLKVMLVDDEVMALNNMKRIMDWNKAGCSIVASETNPQKALDLFKKLRPQIVFVDIKMPIMTGLELSRKMFLTGIPVKIVILTSFKDFEYARKSIEIGVFDYLVKHEINEENLLEKIESLKAELQADEDKEKLLDSGLYGL